MARGRSGSSWNARADAVRGGAAEATGRTADAWGVLRGTRIVTRRWPWAVLAAVAGATTGTAAALAAGRLLSGPVRPGAQEPEDLQAVVDRRPEVDDVPVDEDGERTISLLEQDRPAHDR